MKTDYLGAIVPSVRVLRAVILESERHTWLYYIYFSFIPYDEIYQEALMAFLSLEQIERNKKISDFKNAK